MKTITTGSSFGTDKAGDAIIGAIVSGWRAMTDDDEHHVYAMAL